MELFVRHEDLYERCSLVEIYHVTAVQPPLQASYKFAKHRARHSRPGPSKQILMLIVGNLIINGVTCFNIFSGLDNRAIYTGENKTRLS